jgi:hypothetical protein
MSAFATEDDVTVGESTTSPGPPTHPLSEDDAGVTSIEESIAMSRMTKGKIQLINNILKLQETLVDMSDKVVTVERENASLREEATVMKQYVENMMAKMRAANNVGSA